MVVGEMFKINEEKYRNAILYFASKVGRGAVHGKKKLYKLFYYLDFDFFEKFDRPITGDVYHKLPMGPAPSYLDVYAMDLKKDSLLDISLSKNGNGYQDTVVYKALGNADLSVFDKDEIKMLNAVIAKYGGKTGNELEKMTHEEAPYLATDDGEEIPYELSYYRGSVN